MQRTVARTQRARIVDAAPRRIQRLPRRLQVGEGTAALDRLDDLQVKKGQPGGEGSSKNKHNRGVRARGLGLGPDENGHN